MSQPMRPARSSAECVSLAGIASPSVSMRTVNSHRDPALDCSAVASTNSGRRSAFVTRAANDRPDPGTDALPEPDTSKPANGR